MIPMGPFDLLHPIGRGGMGEVWRAVHRSHGLPVAVKVLTARIARSQPAKVAFRREIQAVAGLDHPHIVLALDHGEISDDVEIASGGRLTAGSPTLAMELGTSSLADELGEPMDWASLRGIIDAVLHALRHAHARGILHRDLKPANVLRFADGTIKLCDFGLAWTQTDDRPRAGGTPRYMAPEQVRSRWRDYDASTDLYSLGCTAWHLATGASPFANHRGARAQMLAQVQEAPPTFEPLSPLPEGVEHWLRTLLQKDPRDRFPSAAAAQHALDDLVADATIQVSMPADWRQAHTPVAMELVGAGLGLYGMRRPPMVGRDRERDALWGVLAEVKRLGRARAVVLHGGAGTGKSRLARWLCERAAEAGVGSSVVAVHAEQPGPLHGVVPALVRALRCQDLERAELAAHLATRLPRWTELQIAELVELVQPLRPGQPTLGVPRVRLASDEARNDVIIRVLRSLDAPVVLWLDDAIWSGESLALAERLLDLDDASVMVLCTVRDEDRALAEDEGRALAALSARADVHDLAVAALSGQEREALVTGLLGLEGDLAAQVARRSGGVPLFAVQLVGDWVQRGIFEATEDGWRLVGGADVSLPDGLHGLWTRRLAHALQDRAEQDRFAVELAAWLGTAISADEWTQACAEADLHVPDDLVDRLVALDLAVRLDGQDWAFVHGMLAESLTRLSSEAGRRDAQRRACAKALFDRGDDDLVVGRLRTGEALLRRAMSLADEPAFRGRVRSRRAGGLASLGRFDEARDEHEACLADGRERGDLRLQGKSMAGLAEVHRLQARLDACERCNREALEIVRASGDRTTEGHVLGNLGALLVMRGRWVEAEPLLVEALAITRERKDRVNEGLALLNLGNLYGNRAHVQEAMTYYAASLPVFEEVGNRFFAGIVSNNLGVLHRVRGEFEEALAHSDRALSIHREVSNRRSEGVTLTSRGSLLLVMGRTHEAEASLLAAREVHDEVGNRRWRRITLGELALCSQHHGRPDEAIELADEALKQPDSGRDVQILSMVMLARLQLRRMRGERELARDLARRTVPMLRESGDKHRLTLAMCALGELVLPERGEAEALLEEAERIAEDLRANPASEVRSAIASLRRALEG